MGNGAALRSQYSRPSSTLQVCVLSASLRDSFELLTGLVCCAIPEHSGTQEDASDQKGNEGDGPVTAVPQNPQHHTKADADGGHNQSPNNPASLILPLLLFRADFVLFSEEVQYLLA